MTAANVLVAVLIAVVAALIVGYLLPGPAAFITFLIVLLLLLFGRGLRV